jgi:hypothetical protein
MIAWLEGTMVCLEGIGGNQEKFEAMDLEANTEEIVVVVEHQEARSEEAIGALEDRSGDQQPTGVRRTSVVT